MLRKAYMPTLFVDTLVNVIASCINLIVRITDVIRHSQLSVFLFEFAASPASIGAIWPSSKQLARQMARPVPDAHGGTVIEIGAGTGVVTQALLDHGVTSQRLCVIERAPGFARHLRQRFPLLNIIQGDAARLAESLVDSSQVTTIVSSLPLRSLPPNVVEEIVAQWRELLPPGGRLIQFTYALMSKNELLEDGFLECKSHIIWTNLPPAKVTVFVRTL